MTRDVPVPDNDQVINEGVLQLFKHSPPGIVFDHIGILIFFTCFQCIYLQIRALGYDSNIDVGFV